jgi:TatD DNase family protein
VTGRSFKGLVDAHAHLNEIALIDPVLADARRAGVAQVVAVGMDLDSNRRTLALAERFPGQVLPAIGYHPWSIRPEALESTLQHIDAELGRCIAMGEVGLDYKTKVNKKLQQAVFERLLAMAVEQGLHRFWWKPTLRCDTRIRFPSLPTCCRPLHA